MNNKKFLFRTNFRFTSVIIGATFLLFMTFGAVDGGLSQGALSFLVIFIVIILLLYFISRFASYLELKDSTLRFVKYFSQKWSVPVVEVQKIEECRMPQEESRQQFNIFLYGRPKTGIRIITTDDKVYEAQSLISLANFESFSDNLKSLNPNVISVQNSDAKWTARI